jgi:predicted enzyme related to lactoylglutathione lyase
LSRHGFGRQIAEKVTFFLVTDDIERDQRLLREAGVRITSPPTVLPHGRVLFFEDLYGNACDLVQRSAEVAGGKLT